MLFKIGTYQELTINLHLKNVEITNGSTTQQERRDTTGRLSDVIMH